MKQKKLPQLRKRILLLCIGSIFAFGAFQAVNAQENPPTRVPSVTSPTPKTTTTRQTREKTLLPNKRYNLAVDYSETVHALPAIDISKVDKKPDQIGVNRAMNLFMKDAGKRYRNSDGSEVLILSIKSTDAVGVRVHFEDFDIPEGDEVYIYGVAPDSEVQGPYSRKGPWKNKEFWSGTVDGDTVIVEYYAKKGARNFRISEVSHVYQNLGSTISPDVLSCQVDASCFSDAEKNAVGRIIYLKSDGAYVCTGTLLNDRNSSFTPYFLTANHCVSTQAVAQTVEAYWFYQTTSCNSGILRSGIVHTVSGSNLLVTSRSGDSTLLRILGTMPGGLVFTGWDPNPKSNGTVVFGFHHPDNQIPPSTVSYLRRADGNISGVTSSCSATGLTNGYDVNWTSGVTERGSSGSGLWYTTQGNNYLVGVLSCGPTNLTCSNTTAIYGKFSDFYPLIQSYIDASSAGPANNNFSSAQTIIGNSGITTGSNIGATKETGEPSHGGNSGGASVWYQWQAPSSGSVTITTAGSSFDTLLGVYTGTSVGSLNTIAGNDDVSTSDRTSIVTFNAVGGTTYRIAVDGFGGATGNIVLNWSIGSSGPANNNFANAQVISGSVGTVTGSNVGATKETGEPSHGGNSGGASVWYQWQAPSSGSVTITTAGSSFDTLLGVYTGTSVGSLNTIASNDDENLSADVLTSKVVFNAVGGTTYRIAVDGYVGTVGNITLNWNLVGGCSYSISPSPQSFASGGGTGSVSVTAGAGCTWTANSNASWITINSGSNGSGSGSVGYTVAANTGATSRSGTITVSGQNFTGAYTVNQAAPFTLTVASISPSSGVSITVSPNDIAGLGNGTTQFTRTYHNNAVVSLTAPATAGSNSFQKWQRGGVDYSANRAINVTMDASYVFTAVYASACQTLTGITPTSGVVGSSVTITGNNFSGVTSVKFSNNISAAFTVNSNTQITATAPNGAVSGPIIVSKTGCSDVQSGTFTVTVPTVQVTVQTSPSGRSFTVDGNTYTTPQTFTWTQGTSHSIGTTSPQSGSAGTQYVWSSWSDGGAISHNVTAPASSTTYTANFGTQYFLTMNAGSGGSVTPASNWFASGQSVTITATPNGGFNFGGWSGSGTGSYTGSNNPSTVTMNGPITETASFTVIPPRIDSVSPAAGRSTGGQQIRLTGAFGNLSTVRMGGVTASWSYSNGVTEITVTTPAHDVGAVGIDLAPTSGNTYTKSNAFAYLPVTFTDDPLVARVTTIKARHIVELRQAVDALRAVAGLQAAPWTETGPLPVITFVRAVHINELRAYLDDVMVRLGYATQSYTDQTLSAGSFIKRIHIEELRQRIKAIAG